MAEWDVKAALAACNTAKAEGYAAGLAAAAQLLEKGWVEDGTYWPANGLTNRAAKAIRALGKEG